MTRKEERIEAAKQRYGEDTQYLIAKSQAFLVGAKWADHNPFGVIDEDFAWNIYNFINKWKNGDFGELPLQRALRDFGKEMIP